MVKNYIPKRGDIVYVGLDPTLGSEQAGRRSAIVLSKERYNSASGLVLLCPVSSRSKGYPFEVSLGTDLKTNGVALVDQLRSVDWRIRDISFVEKLNIDSMEDVLQKVLALIV